MHEATGITVVALTGEHEISTVPALRKFLDGLAESPSWVVVDPTKTQFIDSSVLELFVTWSTASPGPLSAVTAAGTPAARLFELLSLSDVLPTYPTTEDVVHTLKLVE